MRLQQERRERCSGALNGVDGQAGTQRMKRAEDEELGIVLLEELDGAWRREVKEDGVGFGVLPRVVQSTIKWIFSLEPRNTS